jgi:hypothetical protein
LKIARYLSRSLYGAAVFQTRLISNKKLAFWEKFLNFFKKKSSAVNPDQPISARLWAGQLLLIAWVLPDGTRDTAPDRSFEQNPGRSY